MPNNRRRLVGRVVSDKMDKTVVVAVETTKQHRLYGKTISIVKKYLAHDESNAIPVGSTVQIVESRPLSKRKRWVVETVLRQPGEAAVEAASSAEELLGEQGTVEAEAAEAEAAEAEAVEAGAAEAQAEAGE